MREETERAVCRPLAGHAYRDWRHPRALALACAVCSWIICHGAAAAASAAEPAQAPGEAGEPFDLFEIRVLGNTVLPVAEVETALYPSLGEHRSIRHVEQARDALIELYRARGYGAVTVDIPEQDVIDGIVRLQVTEGRLDRLRITGARYFANRQIRRAMSVERGEVLNIPALQADLAAVNRRTADRAVTPVLRAGRTPGTVDLELKVQDELPVHGSLDVNDRYTADTSRTRAAVNLSYGNLFQKLHSLSLQYQTAPESPEETRVLAATYVMPFESTGHSLAIYAVDTNSDVTTIGTLSVLGAGNIYGARYIIPLASIEGRYYHSFIAGADYKDLEERIRLSDSTDVTPIEYVNWSALYNATLRRAHTTSTFSLSANFGIRGLGNDAGPPPQLDQPFFVPGEFGYKRAGAKPNYFYLRADAQHERPFVGSTRLALRLSGQYASEPLISNEQFSIGGAESVRGYLESEALGDYGASGSVEWHTPMWTPQWQAARLNFYGLVFFDAGIVAIVDPLPEQISEHVLASSGLGLRVSGFGGLEAALDWAYPLRSSAHIEAHDARLHFRVAYGF